MPTSTAAEEPATLESLEQAVGLVREILAPHFDAARRVTLAASREVIPVPLSPGEFPCVGKVRKGSLTLTLRVVVP